MDDLVYQFLVQTVGYPRASVLSDTTMLFPNTESPPSFVVVDPKSASPLAAVHVVGAVDAAGLYAASMAADNNAQALRPGVVQGFVVRVDFKGRTDGEKVQFYRSKQNGELYPLSASSFPDLESLKVQAKLQTPQPLGGSTVAVMGGHVSGMTTPHAANNSDRQTVSPDELTEAELLGLDEEGDDMAADYAPDAPLKKRVRPGFWIGVLLLFLAITDAVVQRVTGQPLLQLTHAVLLLAAVLAFSL